MAFDIFERSLFKLKLDSAENVEGVSYLLWWLGARL